MIEMLYLLDNYKQFLAAYFNGNSSKIKHGVLFSCLVYDVFKLLVVHRDRVCMLCFNSTVRSTFLHGVGMNKR